MEEEMAEALALMQDRAAQKEAERRKSSTVRTRIATPGAKSDAGTPRHVPKRFGL